MSRLLKIDFQGAADFIDSLATAIKTFTESMRDSIKAGSETVDFVSARRAAKQLNEMYLRALHLTRQQGIYLIPKAEKYVTVPTASNWQGVREQMQKTLDLVDPLLSGLSKYKGDFVYEIGFSSMMSTLQRRKTILTDVLGMEHPPTSEEEIESFKVFLQSYIGLLRELQGLNRTLAGFLKEDREA